LFSTSRLGTTFAGTRGIITSTIRIRAAMVTASPTAIRMMEIMDGRTLLELLLITKTGVA
jgi:hypothetical protein